MYAGRLVEFGETEEVISEPHHPYTKLLFSAVPNPNLRGENRARVTKVEPPVLVNPPPGCPFAARCPWVMPICKQEMPGITAISEKHWTRCHLYAKNEAPPRS
jgi:peptide/nickel transport system ATP-binding protein